MEPLKRDRKYFKTLNIIRKFIDTLCLTDIVDFDPQAITNYDSTITIKEAFYHLEQFRMQKMLHLVFDADIDNTLKRVEILQNIKDEYFICRYLNSDDEFKVLAEDLYLSYELDSSYREFIRKNSEEVI